MPDHPLVSRLSHRSRKNRPLIFFFVSPCCNCYVIFLRTTARNLVHRSHLGEHDIQFVKWNPWFCDLSYLAIPEHQRQYCFASSKADMTVSFQSATTIDQRHASVFEDDDLTHRLNKKSLNLPSLFASASRSRPENELKMGLFGYYATMGLWGLVKFCATTT